MKNDAILHKWINNTINEVELEQFKLRPEYDSLVELYKKTEHLRTPELDKNQVLSNILTQPKTKATRPSSVIHLPLILKSVAAAAAILVAAFMFWPSQKMVNYVIGTNQNMEGIFPDGSTFILNAVSSLTYDQKAWSNKRLVNLEGEAFFDVEKGSGFVVKTKNGSIEVLGTEFNVRSRKGVLEVSCQEGSVLVSFPNSSVKKKLSATQAVRFTKAAKIEEWIDHHNDGKSWTTGITKLKNVSLEEVINEMRLHYDINFDSTSIDLTEKLSCTFPHNNIDLALSACFNALKIKYEKVGNQQIKLSK